MSLLTKRTFEKLLRKYRRHSWITNFQNWRGAFPAVYRMNQVVFGNAGILTRVLTPSDIYEVASEMTAFPNSKRISSLENMLVWANLTEPSVDSQSENCLAEKFSIKFKIDKIRPQDKISERDGALSLFKWMET